MNNHPVCSCQSGYIGTPPNCVPECIVNSECALDKACINKKCVDPCPNTCGLEAKCTTKNHNPICACLNGYTGDPFVQCYRIRNILKRKSNTKLLKNIFILQSSSPNLLRKNHRLVFLHHVDQILTVV